MSAQKIGSVWAIAFNETDQNVGELSYAAAEVLKIDATATDTTGMAMTLAPTQSGDPVAEFAPDSFDGQTGEFRISDSDLAPHIEEGSTAHVNFWTGPEDDPLRRGFGTVKRKVSIKRGVVTPPPDAEWLMASGAWDDTGIWDDTATWTEAA